MKNDFQNSENSGATQASAGVLATLGRLIGHLGLIHWSVMMGRPKFSAMKDSITTFIVYAAIACVSATISLLIDTAGYPDSAEGMHLTLNSMLIAFAPLGVIFLIVGQRKFPNHLLAVFLACSTSVDITYLVAHMLGFEIQTVSWVAWPNKAGLWVLAWIAFRLAPAEVQKRGYGLREGEI